MSAYREETIAAIREQVPAIKKVICGFVRRGRFSVAAVLIHEAIATS